jgi:membrane protein DedA with SNARE-associated domain
MRMGLPSISTLARFQPYSRTLIFAPAGIMGRVRQLASLIQSLS